ncbi:MAG: hypothetical protein A2Y07_09060 [Planctomycetes bacterium GWF2_50_10]|nr:MAG: hypothetical protein A2Y07_09060 [Planctomycetes bacterium GWF2_50_10]
MSLGVIFDLDGTLVDNNTYHINAWLDTCRRHGRPITEQDYYTHIHARTNDIIVKNLFGNDLDQSFGSVIALDKEQTYRTTYKPYVKPLPGLMDFLCDLRKNSIPAAIASNSPRANVDLVLDELDIKSFFSQILTSDDLTKGKPDPQGFLLAAQRMNLPIEKCVVFEDSHPGFEAARRANARFVVINPDSNPKIDTVPGQLARFADFPPVSVAWLSNALAKP